MLGQLAELDPSQIDLCGSHFGQDSLDPNLILDSLHSSGLASDGVAPRQLLLGSLLSDPTDLSDDISNLLPHGPDLLLGSELDRVCLFGSKLPMSEPVSRLEAVSSVC